jgi:hypothetical protein
MPVRWRDAGSGMGVVDLRELDGDQVVIHYGGALTSVDAYTFANSLISLADVARAVSDVVDEGPLEVRVEALGAGSFRAIIKKIPKGVRRFFSRGAENLFWAYIAFLVIERTQSQEPSNIIINSEEVIIERGSDRVIVPRAVYDRYEAIRGDEKVQESLSRAFEIMEEDEAVENFGITGSLADKEPLVQVPRQDFPKFAYSEFLATLPQEAEAERRVRTDIAVLVVLKLWLKANKNKWSFEWNGVPISASVLDFDFLRKVESGEEIIAGGDAVEAELKYWQYLDPEMGIFVNDNSTFEITKVLRVINRKRPMRLL